MWDKINRVKHIICSLLLIHLSTLSQADFFLDVEGGAFTASRNEVQIPNDKQGDRFEITDLGDDVFPVARFTLGWQPAQRHELQLVYAPLSYSEEGSFDEDIRFDGVTFSKDEQVEARYKFSSYRLRYLFNWIKDDRWIVDIGGTLFVRDASIKLSQNGVNSRDTNLGVVPLLAFRTAYSLSEQWSLVLDSDFAIAPQGRAIDLALLATRKLGRNWTIAGGYRTIEGGADNDDVYSFAWFNGAVIKASYGW